MVTEYEKSKFPPALTLQPETDGEILLELKKAQI